MREKFSSNTGLIFAAAASAVGIGNLVAFPVNAAKGGGAVFLLVYAFFVVSICLPVMCAEMALGRATQRGPLGAYRKISGNHKGWSIAAWLAVITPFMISVFYQVITVWLLIYLIGAISGNLEAMTHPSYFIETVNSPWVFLYLCLLTAFISKVLLSGIKGGVERMSKLMMPILLVILFLLIIFMLFQENAFVGVSYYLVPDFSKLNGSLINSALSQAFFSLSLGMGILVTYGSYMGSNEDIGKSAKVVALIDTLVAFSAGLLILPAIFIFDPSATTDSLSSSSISLVFTFLPKIFFSMQETFNYFVASFIASVFFLLVFFAALTSQVSILQVSLSAIQDELKLSRGKSVLCLVGVSSALVLACTVSFGMVDFFTQFIEYGGQMKSFFELNVDVFNDTILPLNGFFICAFVIYRWKLVEFEREAFNSSSVTLTQYFVGFALKTYVPVILMLIFLNTVLGKFFGIQLI